MYTGCALEGGWGGGGNPEAEGRVTHEAGMTFLVSFSIVRCCRLVAVVSLCPVLELLERFACYSINVVVSGVVFLCATTP